MIEPAGKAAGLRSQSNGPTSAEFDHMRWWLGDGYRRLQHVWDMPTSANTVRYRQCRCTARSQAGSTHSRHKTIAAELTPMVPDLRCFALTAPSKVHDVPQLDRLQHTATALSATSQILSLIPGVGSSSPSNNCRVQGFLRGEMPHDRSGDTDTQRLWRIEASRHLAVIGTCQSRRATLRAGLARRSHRSGQVMIAFHQNSVPSVQIWCRMMASFRATTILAFFGPTACSIFGPLP